MADYPTPSEYQEALQAPEVAFTEPELQSATPRTNALGLPHPITGAFAAVFPVTTDTGGRYAVKCFLNDVPDQQARYEAVAEALNGIDHEALVSFSYQPEGVRVSGAAYPLLKMEWARGTTLNRFVEEHRDRPAILDRLAEAWADLMEELETMGLAHGDLQHGNVIVETAGTTVKLRLVDYDTMYVPALDGWTSAEVGHRNYQHPDRTDADFGPGLDRFAGLVIYTALRACAVRPELWDQYNTGENLLFRDADFYDPEGSPLFDTLANTDPLGDLAEALRTACYVDPTDVPSLAAVREGRLEPSHQTIARARAHPDQEETARTGLARAFLPAAGGMGGVVLALAIAGVPFVAAGILVAGLVTGGVWLGRRYRRLSLVRRRRRLEQEVERFASRIRELEREANNLQEKRDEVRTSKAARRKERLNEIQEEALYDCLKHHFIGEVREVDGLTHKHVVRLKSAGIRTAAEATPTAIDAVRRISDPARVRLKMWRSALEEKYDDEIPESLSPAQERRLERYVQHRIEDLDDQLARTREKIQTQMVERERIEDRLEEMPALTMGRYLRYLLRLEPLPEHRSEGPPVPFTPSESGEQQKQTAVPARLDEERSWWRT